MPAIRPAGQNVSVEPTSESEDVFDRVQDDLVENLSQLLAVVASALRDSFPAYSAFLLRHIDEVVPAAAAAITRVVAEARNAYDNRTAFGSPESPELALFEEIGRRHSASTDSIGALLAAYRTGARIAWRWIATAATGFGAPPDLVVLLAEAVLALVDQLSAASLRGYVQEQASLEENRLRLRGELADLLLSGRSDRRGIEVVAGRAGWALPEMAALIAVRDDAAALRLIARLGDELLPIRRLGLSGGVLPLRAATDVRGHLRSRLAGCEAVVAAPVPLADLPSSLSLVGVGRRLQRHGLLVGDPVFIEDHLDLVIIFRDLELLGELRNQVLRPLQSVPARARDVLQRTLTMWLQHQGDQQRIAAELQIHRQTVHYRLVRLRELFGERLDEPRYRAKLVLALAGTTGRSVER